MIILITNFHLSSITFSGFDHPYTIFLFCIILKNTNYGKFTISCQGTKVWDTIPEDIRYSTELPLKVAYNHFL